MAMSGISPRQRQTAPGVVGLHCKLRLRLRILRVSSPVLTDIWSPLHAALIAISGMVRRTQALTPGHGTPCRVAIASRAIRPSQKIKMGDWRSLQSVLAATSGITYSKRQMGPGLAGNRYKTALRSRIIQ